MSLFESKEQAAASEIVWTEEALKRMERAPVFLRGMVKRLAEKKARELGYSEITEEILTQFKGQMMGKMGGQAGFEEAAGAMAAGRLPWTAEAKARLETVPEFMLSKIKQIAEEAARERGHMEVNVELFKKVETLGDEKSPDTVPLPWTAGAQARLQQKIANAPAIAMDFVTDMLTRDTEQLAREQGRTVVDEDALKAIWDA